jgi:hypothetical protein
VFSGSIRDCPVSLCVFIATSIEYVAAFINQLEHFAKTVLLTHQQKSLLWLGVVKESVIEENKI